MKKSLNDIIDQMEAYILNFLIVTDEFLVTIYFLNVIMMKVKSKGF